MKDLKHKSCKECWMQLGLSALKKRRLRSDLTALYNCRKGNCSNVGVVAAQVVGVVGNCSKGGVASSPM